MKIQAKLLLESNAYDTWTWVTIDTRKTLSEETEPWLATITRDYIMSNKIFNHDIVTFRPVALHEEDQKGEATPPVHMELTHSVVRCSATLSGVLLMNKSYGRCTIRKTGKPNKPNKSNKFWYRCVPNDKRLPSFLLPYPWNGMRSKGGAGEFEKQPINRFVIFRFTEWTDTHPRGEILETLGKVSSLNAYYEYQLYSRSIHSSIKEFVDATRKALLARNQQDMIEEFTQMYTMQDRTDEIIYSIDPHHCKDIDDAFHASVGDDGHYHVSIYIANVPLWLEMLDLWNAFSNRVATIYLPDRKRPMMPTQLSDNLCSLKEGHDRFALALDMVISATTSHVVESSFHICRIRVTHNYQYDSPALRTDPMYLLFHEIASRMNELRPYLDKRVLTVDATPEKAFAESHRVISYWMIQMNYVVAQTLRAHDTGLFRTASLQPSKTMHLPALPETMLSFLQVWKSSGGAYVNLRDAPSLSHDLLKVDAYVHVTSPIRRLADLLNMVELMRVLGLGFHKEECRATQFYAHWTSQDMLAYMNTSMRAIRRVQQDCELIAKCAKHPEWLTEPVEGFVFDGIMKTDGLYQYTVYLPDPKWKLITRCICQYPCEEYSKHMFRIYTFTCGETARQKIKVEMCR